MAILIGAAGMVTGGRVYMIGGRVNGNLQVGSSAFVAWGRVYMMG